MCTSKNMHFHPHNYVDYSNTETSFPLSLIPKFPMLFILQVINKKPGPIAEPGNGWILSTHLKNAHCYMCYI